MRFSRFPLLLAGTLALGGCDEAARGVAARDEIRVVGSSTVYPFTTRVAELYVAAHPGAPAPVIESTGTGAGIRLFCSGTGAAMPDIVDASRRLRAGEYKRCVANGAGALLEVPIGRDGIAIAAARDGPRLSLTPRLLYRALAAAPAGRPNQAKNWRDVDPRLPATPIAVYGPPATSGTRDAFAELILARGCDEEVPGAAALRMRDPAAYAARCMTLRDDGAYRDAGENDNLIVQKLATDPTALGIFGYAYLAENAGVVRGVPMSGVLPSYASIADGRYPGARPLYLYIKAAHLRRVPGLAAFLDTYASAWQPNGPLAARGLIAGSVTERARAARIVETRTPLDPAALPS